MIGPLLIALLQAAAGDPLVAADPASPAPAEPAAPAQPAPEAAPAKAPPARHCVTQREIGSLMPKRVCRTAAQEQRAAEEARHSLERMDSARTPGSE